MRPNKILLVLKLLLIVVILSKFKNQIYAERPITFIQENNISEDLSSILNKLSAQFKVSIVFDAQHVDDLKIENFTPKTTIEENLDILLQSTNLTYKKLSTGTYIIKLKDGSLQNSNIGSELTQESLAEINVHGIIKDAESSEPLIGANVLQVGTNNGTVSDIDGAFQLKVEEESTLEISYIGYITKNIVAVNEGPYEVFLSRNTNLMEEVIVVGYGSQRKSDLTGSISRIAEVELKQLPNTGIEQAIQGRSAGVYITQNSGAPGGAMSIRIRGTGSTLSAEPLYVIDGIPIVNDNTGTSATFETDGGGQYTNALTTINPNDIESVEILKDASASAIYGARAANGVVIITTKKGKEGKRVVSYDSYIGLQQLQRSIPVMNLRQYAEYINDVNIGTVEEFQNLELLGEGTNWQDVIFRDAFMHNHQFSITGGDAQTRFSFNGGLHQKDGIVQGSDFTRQSGKINVDHSYNENVRVGVNILASKTKENLTFNDNSNGVIYTALLTPPMVPARTLDGSYGTPPSGNNIVLTFDNPLANALDVEDVNRKTRLLASFYTEIDFKPWLKYRMEVATDILYTNHNTFWPAFERGTQSRKSRVRRNNNNSLYWINKHLVTYQNTFSQRHKVTLLGGFEAQEGKYEWIYATRDNLPTNALKEINLGDAGTQVVQGGAGHWALLSYFGRLNYGFDDRYLLTGTLRVDGSSRFGSNHKYGLFPSLAFAWRASNENILKDIDALNNLKLRIGYGAVGNQEIGLYSFAANLQPVNVVVGNQLVTGFAPDNIANEDVKWESSVQTNLGLDIGFLNNRFEMILDIYNKSSRDMLLPAILPATAGSLNPPFINIGEMRNSGFEITLNTQNFTGKLNWKTSVNLSVNKNEVVDLGSTGVLTGIIQRVPITRTEEGLPIGQYYGHQVEGIFRNAAEIAEAPFQEIGTRAGDIKFKDLNNDGVVDDLDKTFIGSPHPDFTINLINDVSYSNFDLNVFIRGVYGNEVYNMLRRDLAGTGAWHNQSVDIIDRWTVDNPDGSEPRSNGNDPNQNRRVSDRFVEDGSYIKLQNVSLGYTVPNQVMGIEGISNLRLYISGQNLITITNYSGYDPEIGSFNQNPLISGVDNGRFPVARSYTFGLNLNF